MYDIRQFRPVIYLLLWTGISAFALAAQSPPVWIVATGAILLNHWLVRKGRFKPLPRLLANAITLVAAIAAVVTYHDSQITGTISGPPILLVGQFLVALQLVKLYEQRGNRDYAQLLVLSLLLVVAAAISTSKLEAGILVILYMFLSLYACLLFHLKVEADHAKAAIGVSEEHINPMTLRQDQRYLARSMRRLTSVISIVAVALAVIVFLFFPRNIGAGLFGQLQQRPSQAMTGFSDSVSFQEVAKISQSAQIIAYVQLWDDDRPIEGTRTLMLRGATLDVYTGNLPGNVKWQWQRTQQSETAFDDLAEQRTVELESASSIGSLRQDIRLDPTGSEQLFALAGVTNIRPLSTPSGNARLRYGHRDQTVRLEPIPDRTFHYEAYSTGALRATRDELPHARDFGTTDPGDGRLTQSIIDPRIEEYARRPEVSGSDNNGPLAVRRDRTKLVTDLDERIAANIAQHLMGDEFSYTLDLSDAKNVGNRDPVEAFLYTLKRGHCEYFAGSMVLMCQSLGMQARLVIGFKCDEYNAMTQTYVVRQNQAHAWVEVLNDEYRWVTFDPTSGRDLGDLARKDSAWSKVKQFVDYLEYTWANEVVAYDRDARTNVIQNVETSLNNSADTSMESMRKAKKWFDLDALTDTMARSALLAQWSAKLVAGLIVLLSLALVSSVSWFLFERWKLRRRARRMGLAALPQAAQLRMAKQLGFYDDLMRLLARHKIVSPAHLTPLEFSQSLLFLPNELFDTIRRVTGIYYRVRYGAMEVSSLRQRKLKTTVAQIEAALGSPT